MFHSVHRPPSPFLSQVEGEGGGGGWTSHQIFSKRKGVGALPHPQFYTKI